MSRHIATTGARRLAAVASRSARVLPTLSASVHAGPSTSTARSAFISQTRQNHFLSTIRNAPPAPAPAQPYSTHPPTPSAAANTSPLVHAFFDVATATWTYVVIDPSTSKAIVVDPVLDYDPASGRVAFSSVQALAAFIKKENLDVTAIMETHVHADHLTGAFALKELLPAHPPVHVGDKVHIAQGHFGPVYGLDGVEMGASFDAFMPDGGSTTLGNMAVSFMALPGHTPESMGILIGDALFAGDSIFLPDVGTARVDFPGGSAAALYDSIQRMLALDSDVRIFSGHDYAPASRPQVACMASVGAQREHNKHVGGGATEESFVRQRNERDAELGAPRLLHASLQVNLRAGRMPEPDEQGRAYMKTPVRLPGA